MLVCRQLSSELQDFKPINGLVHPPAIICNGDGFLSDQHDRLDPGAAIFLSLLDKLVVITPSTESNVAVDWALALPWVDDETRIMKSAVDALCGLKEGLAGQEAKFAAFSKAVLPSLRQHYFIEMYVSMSTERVNQDLIKERLESLVTLPQIVKSSLRSTVSVLLQEHNGKWERYFERIGLDWRLATKQEAALFKKRRLAWVEDVLLALNRGGVFRTQNVRVLS